MRLLRADLMPAENLFLEDFHNDNLPPYAILSHTWGSDEVQFNDINETTPTYHTKEGFFKIQFCQLQAIKAGLKYFWIDTCCIDKTSSAELTETINSMYQWYQNAMVCFVHLPDVSSRQLKRRRNHDPRKWIDAFRKSRWFTRSWTLQELIAPVNLKFFSREGDFLGDRDTFLELVSEITGIPQSVFLGSPLDSFSVDERFQWAKNRHATRAEDEVYSLLGILGVHMPLLYGEGKAYAFRRLTRELEAQTSAQSSRSYLDESKLPSGYSRLAESQFRLLILEPGQLGDTLRGHLTVCEFSNCPAYYALSYVWGYEASVHNIVVDGEKRSIQSSLFYAMQRIRPRKGRYYMWVDSLCINQKDNSERSNQVKQMSSIYNKASGVLIWLGEEDATSKTAIEFVSEILSKQFRWTDSWWEQHGFVALAQLLERTWFRRGWVIQEAAVSKRADLRCGDQTVNMDQFVMVVNSVRNRLGNIPASFDSRLTNFHNSPAIKFLDIMRDVFGPSMKGDLVRRRLSLETLVDLTTSTETSDERDAIYAFLNLANDTKRLDLSDQSEIIKVDYEKPSLDVFADFIVHCCTRWSTLDIICRPWAPVQSSSVYNVSHGVRPSRLTPEFPSWIASRDNLPFGNPSWKLNHRIHGDFLVGRSRKPSYYAHYGTKPAVRLGTREDGSCNGILRVEGCLLGTIVTLSERMAQAIISKACLEILLTNWDVTHANDTELPDVIWRTLCANRDIEGRRAPHLYSSAMQQLLKVNFKHEDTSKPNHPLGNMVAIDAEELLHEELPEIVEEYLKVVRDIVWNRRTFCAKTDDGADKHIVGLAPPNAKIGDCVCILFGCSTPVVLRRSQFTEESGWQLLGDAYVHGAMEGEMISSLTPEKLRSMETEFALL